MTRLWIAVADGKRSVFMRVGNSPAWMAFWPREKKD
jgi:hypothetical protein